MRTAGEGRGGRVAFQRHHGHHIGRAPRAVATTRPFAVAPRSWSGRGCCARGLRCGFRRPSAPPKGRFLRRSKSAAFAQMYVCRCVHSTATSEPLVCTCVGSSRREARAPYRVAWGLHVTYLVLSHVLLAKVGTPGGAPPKMISSKIYVLVRRRPPPVHAPTTLLEARGSV